MKPDSIYRGFIPDIRTQGQAIDYEKAERNRQAILGEQYVEEEQASRLIDGLHPVY